jgi:hypothetical protein
MTEPSRPQTAAAGGRFDSAGTGGGRRPERADKRPRRDFVTWVALGLLVVVVLAIVTKTTTVATHDPRRADGRAHLHSPLHLHHSDHVSSTRDPTAGREPLTTGIVKKHRSTSRSITDPAASTPKPPSTSTTLPLPTTTTSTEPEHPSTTTPPPPTTAPPTTSGQLQYSGTLSYPEDVGTSIPFSSSSGIAAVRVTWSGGDELVASLRCRGAHDSAPGTHGISISIDGAPGACDAAIALGSGVRSRVAYTITVLAPSEDG